MKRNTVPAEELQAGMIIIPPLRTMRHAEVERIVSRGVEFGEGKLAKFAGMKNHDGAYVYVSTDIGGRSFKVGSMVDVYEPQYSDN